MKKFMTRITLAVLVIVAAGFTFLFLAKTKDRGPGPYSSGFQTTKLQVPHRDEDLDLFVWYPTRDDLVPTLIGQNALFYGHYVRQNAKPQQEILPLVIFSHGSGGNAYQIGWMAEALAAKGYVVLATNHPGTTSRNSLPERTVMIWERAQDLHELLNWAENPTIDSLSLDAKNAAAIGFSLGGHSALAVAGLQVSKSNFIEYCERNPKIWDCGWLTRGGVNFSQIDATLYEANYQDARIRATVAIDPALTPAATSKSAATISHPVMIINLEPNGGVVEALDASEIAQSMADARYETLPQSWHFSFLPECSVLGKLIIGASEEENICSDWKLKNRQIVHQTLIDLIVPFLDENI